MPITSPRASALRQSLLAPLAWSGRIEEWTRKVAEVANSLRDGKINTVSTVTLTANTTTTTITDPRISANTFIGLMPTTATAQTAMGAGWRIACTEGQAVITHNNTADTDKTLQYAILG